MDIKKVKLPGIIVNPEYILSFPIRPDLYANFEGMFPGMPGIFLNRNGELVAGLDLYTYKLSEIENRVETGAVKQEITVLESDFSAKDALILNYNLKDKWTGLNLYEKLIFIKKIKKHARPQELYQRTGLDINLKPKLMDNLEILLQSPFQKNLISGSITLKTALGVCSLEPEDRVTLLALFHRIPFTSSQQLKLLEMCEELIFRHKIGLNVLFQELIPQDLMESERPQGRIMEIIANYRYPLHSDREKEFRQYLSGLLLPGNIKISHAPFFEKKDLEIKISLTELRELPGTLASLGGKAVPLPEALAGGPGLAGQGEGSQGKNPDHKQAAKKGK